MKNKLHEQNVKKEKAEELVRLSSQGLDFDEEGLVMDIPEETMAAAAEEEDGDGVSEKQFARYWAQTQLVELLTSNNLKPKHFPERPSPEDFPGPPRPHGAP